MSISKEDVDKIARLAHVNDLNNVSREDKSQPSLSKKQVFKNSPKHDDEYFLVPKVLKT